MFNFTGTFSSGQFDAFKEFTEHQRTDLEARRKWLVSQLNKVGIYVTQFDDDGLPVRYAPKNPKSYAEKLMQAYRILGGIPEQDFILRDRNHPVFLKRGNPIQDTGEEFKGGFSDIYSNGRRNRGGMRFDQDMGIKVNKLKSWQLEAIKRKREHLEYKMKRVLDFSDQLIDEIARIDKLLGDDRNSLDAIISAIEVEITNPENINVVEGDRFGYKIGKPADFTRPDLINDQIAENQRGGVKL